MPVKSRNLLTVNELRCFENVIFDSMNMKFSAFALACLVGFSFAADPRMEQGARFEAQGNFEMALGEYRSILAEQPKNAEAYFAAAEVRVKMKDYSGALANYRLAYKFDPAMSAAYEGAAKVYESLGQKAKAEAERAKDPKNNPAPAEEVAAPVEPAPAAEPVKVAEPAPVAVEAPKAEPVAEAKPEPKVEPKPETKVEPKAEPVKVAAEPAKEETAQALPSDPFEKGKALYAEGNYADAAKAWREVLKKTPGHAGAYFYAGLTRFQLGEYEKAEFNLKKGLEYKEEGNDANYFLACVYQKMNKSDLEVKFLANYMKKAAPNGKYRKAAEERLAEIKAAKAEASKTEEKIATAEAVKQDVKAERMDKSEKAVEASAPKAAEETEESDVAAAPSAVPTIANANLLFGAGSYEMALQMYKALLETEQNPEERYFTMLQLGNVYRELRDFHSAVTRYREVVQQFPDSDWATEAERALEDAVWLEKHAKELPRRVR
ncbi:Tetratricopeptide repeat-containing protein [Fibrobacter sp. UWH5]|nr:Tetratricopeptide repeat-containing protein [Fibrobacter sp. UWH5]